MNKVVTHALAGVAGVAVGFGIGYLVSKKRMEAYVDQEIESVKQAYANAPFRKEGVFATPESAVEALIPESERIDTEVMEKGKTVLENLLGRNGYVNPQEGDRVQLSGLGDEPDLDGIVHKDESGRITINPIDPETGEEVTEENQDHNLWDDIAHGRAVVDPSELEDDPELAAAARELNAAVDQTPGVVTDVTENPDADRMPPRDLDKPFIVTVDEFMHADVDLDQKISLTFYEEDEVLADERDQVVRDVETQVGEANLHNFGLGSRDKNIVYVFNPTLVGGTYFEIFRNENSYTEIVLGEKPVRNDRPLRMRDDAR